MEQKEFKVGQIWKRRRGGTETIRATRTDGAYPIIGRVTTYTREGKCFACEDSSMDLVELIQDAPPSAPVPWLESSSHETLSATVRAAIKSAIVELQGQAAHAADERDAALTRFEEAAARQREKALAAIELGTLLVRMPESTD